MREGASAVPVSFRAVAVAQGGCVRVRARACACVFDVRVRVGWSASRRRESGACAPQRLCFCERPDQTTGCAPLVRAGVRARARGRVSACACLNVRA